MPRVEDSVNTDLTGCLLKLGCAKLARKAQEILSVFRCDDSVDDQFKILTENINILLFSTLKINHYSR